MEKTKGILKKSSDKKAPDHIKWDEKGIEEYDLQRGGKQKISEPKTPYEDYKGGVILLSERRRRGRSEG